MGKLLETRLPIAQGDMVSIDTFNRLVRIIELNLGRFDTTGTPQYTNDQRNAGSFTAGDVIWNTTTEELQESFLMRLLIKLQQTQAKINI